MKIRIRISRIFKKKINKKKKRIKLIIIIKIIQKMLNYYHTKKINHQKLIHNNHNILKISLQKKHHIKNIKNL